MAELNNNLSNTLLQYRNSQEFQKSKNLQKERMSSHRNTVDRAKSSEKKNVAEILPGQVPSLDTTTPELKPTLKKVASNTPNIVKLKDIPKNSVAFQSFQLFCKQEFSEENLKFSQEIDEVLALSTQSEQTQEKRLIIQKKLKRVYDRFIADNAPHLISMSFAMKKSFAEQNALYEKMLANSDNLREDCFQLDSFRLLRDGISKDLEQGALARFLKTSPILASTTPVMATMSMPPLPPVKEFLAVNDTDAMHQKIQFEKVASLQKSLKKYLEVNIADSTKNLCCFLALCMVDRKQVYENIFMLHQSLSPYLNSGKQPHFTSGTESSLISRKAVNLPWDGTKIIKWVAIALETHQQLIGKKNKDLMLRELEETYKYLKMVIPPSPTLTTTR